MRPIASLLLCTLYWASSCYAELTGPADGHTNLRLLAKQEISAREASMPMSYLYRELHPPLGAGQEQPRMTFLRHNPIAQRLRENIYTRKSIVAEKDPQQAYDMIEKAIAALPEKLQKAVRKLPPRAIGEEEIADVAPTPSLPVELSDMIHDRAVRLHMEDVLRVSHGSPLLHLAEVIVFLNYHHFIDYLVWLGLDPRKEPDLLLQAVMQDDIQCAERLIFYGANKVAQDDDGEPLLALAVQRGSVSMAKLLMNPMDLFWKSDDGFPLTYFAARNGDYKMMHMLFEHGLDKEWKDGNGLSLLYWGILPGDREFVRYMIKAGADANNHNDETSCLAIAIRNRLSGIAKILLRAGADPNFRGRNGVRLLHQAFDYGMTDVVTCMFEHGADIEGNSSLLRTTMYTYDNVRARSLLQAGVSPHAMDDGRNALWTALTHGSYNIAALLVEYGADVNARVDNTPLINAVKSKEAEAWLLRYGADPNWRDDDGLTLLSYAVQAGDEEKIQLLLKHKAKMPKRDLLRQTDLLVHRMKRH